MDYNEATSGFRYNPGDHFVKVWDAKAYQDAAAMPEDEWADEYDHMAKAYRQRLVSDPSSRLPGYAGPMLMRELLVSAEYADDWLPFCSDEYSATYRISSARCFLRRSGAVNFNLRKLKMLLIIGTDPRVKVVALGANPVLNTND